MESKEMQSKLWKVIESRDRSLTQGLHRWDKQEKALVERRDEIISLKKATDEKDQEIRSLKDESNEKDEEIRSLKDESNEKDEEIQSLKTESNEKDEEIRSLKAESNEKDEEITALKSTLDIRLKILEEQHAELERIKTSLVYRVLHRIRHPENLFKKKI